MRLTEWINEFHEENENLDILLQIVLLLRDSGKGRGIISPALYEVDSFNNVKFTEPGGFPQEMYKEFAAPENVPANVEEWENSVWEKSDIFSLGLLMYYLLNRKICPVNRPVSMFTNPFSKSRRKNTDPCAAMAADSRPISMLMERMTSYDPGLRPNLKEVSSILSSDICRFGIIFENIQTGERYTQITRSFTGSAAYKFVPEKEYIINSVTIAPLSCEPLMIPFRLVEKQYVIQVVYGGDERWLDSHDWANSLSGLPADLPLCDESLEQVHKATAALFFCDAVYGIKGNALFCETNGYSYEMGLYEHKGDSHKQISVLRDGSIAVPERIEARALSILREVSKTIHDLYCVAVYGNLTADVIKAINDIFPQAIRIYKLDDEDLRKGAAIYLSKNIYPKQEVAHEV
jgi:hypothetical protein